ncbi:RNA polymerase sigma factor FliA [Citrobacter amalonaticus]|uniref:RNA polymerase sigma factor FliA n=1 Tax=Citrobacter amalonaticus TaxID=35703 RepID=A0A2S4RRP7_CITAM|nr:FliA/WhiG family RNA polymerase sigma factor [Citrobacter amalonaticus]POT58640.1 RNA polymerase sigma factor FliA [Citrobacter amalonaticus]POT70378.1 RNA polymerase sigma factor FliA [Citrobacter amalonaticus]POU61362.1 RNA polymerase sigma factor FliA [Citrobacter amalonaticus]POV05070.1 RNA polymerase sigma factor FliA [Citrobacter amalonaticus]
MIQDAYENEEFTATPVLTPQEESHYLQAYLPLVRKVVRQLAPQCTCVIDRQDMEQTALMGLLNAIRRYGLPDEGFAGYAVHRIRGAILDELRSLDWRPRQLRQKYHQIKDLIRDARKTLGHEPDREALCALGLTSEDYLEYQQLEGAETLASLDELLGGESHIVPLEGRALEEQIVTQDMLSFALSQLSEKERLVLSMYYQHDMNLKEIALVLGLTEARICQMNKKITQKIRDCLYPD